jgi:hypothetical protein
MPWSLRDLVNALRRVLRSLIDALAGRRRPPAPKRLPAGPLRPLHANSVDHGDQHPARKEPRPPGPPPPPPEQSQ